MTNLERAALSSEAINEFSDALRRIERGLADFGKSRDEQYLLLSKGIYELTLILQGLQAQVDALGKRSAAIEEKLDAITEMLDRAACGLGKRLDALVDNLITVDEIVGAVAALPRPAKKKARRR